MAHILIAGDVHGAIGLFYEQALRLQDELKEPIEAILQVGDLQVYSEASHVDKAVSLHGGPAGTGKGRREGNKQSRVIRK